MLRPYEVDAMEAYPVSSAVNQPANDSPEVLKRAA
jgi:putative SOS response-associated peptidase YedK